MCYAATPTGASWQVTFAELELTYIELQDEAQHLVDEITPPHHGIYLHGNSWRHYVSQLPASTTGVYSTLVPARMCSIKSLVCLPRRTTEVSSTTSYSLSSRVNPQIASYWWRCGSILIPARYVTLWNSSTTSNFSEGFAELQKNFHSLTSPDYAGSIPFLQYNVVDANRTPSSPLPAPFLPMFICRYPAPFSPTHPALMCICIYPAPSITHPALSSGTLYGVLNACPVYIILSSSQNVYTLPTTPISTPNSTYTSKINKSIVDL